MLLLIAAITFSVIFASFKPLALWLVLAIFWTELQSRFFPTNEQLRRQQGHLN